MRYFRARSTATWLLLMTMDNHDNVGDDDDDGNDDDDKKDDNNISSMYTPWGYLKPDPHPPDRCW